MTEERRSKLIVLIEQLSEIQMHIDCLSIDEEKECDNSSGTMQDDECDEFVSEAVDDLQSACDCLDEVIEYLNAAAK